MFLNSIILGLVVSSTVSASPIHEHSIHAEPGAQSCTAADKGAYLSYSINIGAAYDSNYCDTILEYLQWKAPTGAPTNWGCVSDGSDSFDGAGNYQLWFDSNQTQMPTAEGINTGLSLSFPKDVINGFNCPDQSVGEETERTGRLSNH
jgi:hypothetical protein